MYRSRSEFYMQKAAGKRNKLSSRYSGEKGVSNYNLDTTLYGKYGVRSINKSLNKGKTYKQAVKKGVAASILTSTIPGLATVGLSTVAYLGAPKLASKINSNAAKYAARKGRKLLEKGIDMTKATAFSKHKIRPGQVISIK